MQANISMKTLFPFWALLVALTLGVLPLRAQSPRDAIAERANFVGRDAHKLQRGFQVAAGRAVPALVVLPDHALPVQEFAAKELIEHVFKATGARLPLVRERELKAGEAARPKIYIGGVRALKNIGARGAAGFGDVRWLEPGRISVLAPDAVRQVKEVSKTLWMAVNNAGADGKPDGAIDVVLDLGEKKRIAALAIKNRGDVATNYNIGRVQIAVGQNDDGQNFDTEIGNGTPVPVSNAVAAERILALKTPVNARYFRLRITSNLFGEMGSEASANNAVWDGIGFVLADEARAADGKVLDLNTLPPNGFLLKTQGDALYLAGRDENGPPLADNTQAGTLFAVYEWLERQAGVHWLWPGELGTQVPRAGVLLSGAWDVLAQPPLLHARWRQTIGRPMFIPAAGGFTAEQRSQVVADEVLWYRRNRFARGVSLEYGHGYEDFWERFHATHPEYFNLLPDGTRRSDPFYYGGEGRLISMSVGEPGFQQQVIEDWKARRSAERPWINGWENDTNGKCVGAECLALDVRDPAFTDEQWNHRVENARRAFENKEADWVKHLGSLSDRYARYYLALQKRGREIDPTATVIGGAYANYAKAPLQTKLNRNIVVGIVPEYGWPTNAKTFAGFQTQWGGWHGAGASLYLRPNYTLWGHEQPIITARDWARDFQFAYKNGMIGTDYDSLTSMWATQGPNIYVLSRLHTRPDWPVEKILAEYYGAFGAGKTQVQKYFDYWQAQTTRAGKEMQAMKAQATGAQLFSGWAGLHQVIGKIYTPENYAAAARFLEAAHAATRDDKTAQKRVEFLQAGLEDARLVAKTNRANDEFKRTTKNESFVAALGELDRHRAQMAQKFPNALNLDLAAWMENRDWNRAVYSAINSALRSGDIVAELPSEWRLRWDEDKVGQRESWFQNPGADTLWQPVSIDAPWEEQKVGKDWKAAHADKDYDGLAWYRVRFKVDPKWRGKKLALLFGAVDEAATVYLNGQKAGEHPYINPNDWQTPFQIDVTKFVDFESENELMVLVEDNSGAGGVWKPVWLISPR
jgi:hypothetical protein